MRLLLRAVGTQDAQPSREPLTLELAFIDKSSPELVLGRQALEQLSVARVPVQAGPPDPAVRLLGTVRTSRP